MVEAYKNDKGQPSPNDSVSSGGLGKTTPNHQGLLYIGVPSTQTQRYEANLPGMSKENVFLYGVAGQVERYLKSVRGLIDWVGASKEYKNIMSTYLMKKEEPTFDEPDEPEPSKEGNISMAKMERYKMQLRKQMDDQDEWNESKGRLFRTTINLCSRPLRNKLESDKKFTKLEEAHDVNGLLDLIKELVYSTDESQEPIWIMADTVVKLHSTRQQDTESDNNYYKRFVSQAEVTESVWGSLIPTTMKGKATELQTNARHAYLARLFLKNLNRRHQEDVRDLGKAFIDGNNNYPKDLESALSWITNRKENQARATYKNKSMTHTTNDNKSMDSKESKTTRFNGFQCRRPWTPAKD